ncbi:dihydropyrimidinase [Naasia lichenicola]|uniref:Dihydropyrimidinase n=1 Tax=Naasia lichenicola TaxID=2565933 RepID=A0A4V3WTU1_9MICO|nr:dihydropyrimidinase [Naasia lichenicola]THG33287.1 dihydropyrimidinase [Naasia lichenicola]
MTTGASIVVRGGRVLQGDDLVDADVLIEDGIITAIGAFDAPEGVAVEDATGLIVLPGMIDPHVHVGWPGAADDFATGSRAAIAGGVTTFIEFAVQFPGERLEDVVQTWKDWGARSACDFALHAIVSDSTPATLEAMGRVVEAGVTSFKMFMTSQHSGGLGVDDGTLFEIMQRVAELGGLSMAHCENDEVIGHLAEKLIADGVVTSAGHSAARPPLVEAEAIARAVRLADAAGSAFYIPHLSSGDGLQAALLDTGRRVPVIAETCPQFLALTADVYSRPDGAHYVMSPPIKSAQDQVELWEGIMDGRLSTVGSDHCPYPRDFKDENAHTDFRRIPNGVPGVETLLPVMFTLGVRSGRLTIGDLARICSLNPARIFGLDDRKGSVSLGKDGDLVLFDPDRRFGTAPSDLNSDIDYSIYEDLELWGMPVATIASGSVVAREQRIVDDAHRGRFLARTPGVVLDDFDRRVVRA